MVEAVLPELITLSEYDGNWQSYLEAIYQSYLDDVVNSKLHYNTLPIKFQFRPMYEGKGFAFWHTISEGEKEENRTADLRRCERITWIAWMIKNAPVSNEISSWENKRGKNHHVVIFFEAESFVVILAKRNGYYLFKTAYVTTPQRKKQLIKERKEYLDSRKTKGALYKAPSDAPSTRGR